MHSPFAPITPAQEAEIRALAATYPRRVAARILDGLSGLDYGRAAERLRRLKGEPEPPFIPEPAANPAAVRAENAALRERLDAAYATRTMQQHALGLDQPSWYAGFNGNPRSTTR